jgi:hypothetical protein
VIAVDIDEDPATGSLDEDRHGDAQTAGKFSSALHLQLLGYGTWDGGGQDSALLWLRHVFLRLVGYRHAKKNRCPNLGAICPLASCACAF